MPGPIKPLRVLPAVLVDARTLAVAYRLCALAFAVAGSLLTELPRSSPAIVAGVAAGSVSAIFVAGLVWPGLVRHLVPWLLLDLAVGAACVGLTGGTGSPFVLYVAAPVVNAALVLRPEGVVALLGLAAAFYAAALTVIAPRGWGPEAVPDLGELILLGFLTFGARSLALRAPAREPESASLSPRQRTMLAAVGRGLSNKEIAAELGLSEDTVKGTLRHTYEVLRVTGRVQAVTRAEELRLISPTTPGSEPSK